jgi:hypothetical protein
MIRVVGLLLAAFCGPASAASCWGTTVRHVTDQTVRGDMYVVSGKPCSRVLLRSRGPTFSVRVMEQPTHGRVSVRGLRVVYVSRPGFIGDDRFVYAWEGNDTLNQPRTNTVEMHVRVSDRL